MKPRTDLISDAAIAASSLVEVSLLAELFDHTPEMAFFVKDAEGRYIAVNESLVKRHGWRHKSDVLGKLPTEICSGELGAIPARQDQRILRTGKPLLDQLEMQLHRPQHANWCLTTKMPIRDREGNIIGLIGFSRDVRAMVEPEEIPIEFAKALEEFEQTLSTDVNPTWLAKRSKLSPHRLSRMTKRIFDLTPGQFITKIRIAAATRLLRESDLSVADIAHRCGFYDHSAFTRKFRSATGMTPTNFRRAIP